MDIQLRSGQHEHIDIDKAVDLIINEAQYVHWYDALPSGNPNQLDTIDLAFPAFLDAMPNFKTLLAHNGWRNTQSALDKASGLLSLIPEDVTLADWPDTEPNRALLADLFRATTGGNNRSLPGFGPARCTKMLHKKRPELLPSIDSWQLEAWGKRFKVWHIDDMVDVVFEIKNHILPWVGELNKLSECLKNTDPSLPTLSAIRLYDILFWELSSDRAIGTMP